MEAELERSGRSGKYLEVELMRFDHSKEREGPVMTPRILPEPPEGTLWKWRRSFFKQAELKYLWDLAEKYTG